MSFGGSTGGFQFNKPSNSRRVPFTSQANALQGKGNASIKGQQTNPQNGTSFMQSKNQQIAFGGQNKQQQGPFGQKQQQQILFGQNKQFVPTPPSTPQFSKQGAFEPQKQNAFVPKQQQGVMQRSSLFSSKPVSKSGFFSSDCRPTSSSSTQASGRSDQVSSEQLRSDQDRHSEHVDEYENMMGFMNQVRSKNAEQERALRQKVPSALMQSQELEDANALIAIQQETLREMDMIGRAIISSIASFDSRELAHKKRIDRIKQSVSFYQISVRKLAKIVGETVIDKKSLLLSLSSLKSGTGLLI